VNAVARLLPDPTQAQQTLELLQEPLARTPDPEMALGNLLRWGGQLVNPASTFATLRDDPRLLQDLLCVFASSQYLADILVREPALYSLLLEPHESWRKENLHARIAAAVAPFSRLESRLQALRRARRRELLRIGWRDLTGWASFETVVAKISDLAEALIEQTLAAVRVPLAERQPELDAQVRFAVIAMGKLGGRELNYSSDVDLLFLYDSPSPDDPAHIRCATRLGEALFTALSATTADGSMFRVDMRLRPEGRFGALVRSLASYREYYDRWMETWERQALIKARPVAGDTDLGRQFAALAQDRAYPTMHAASLFEDVRDMRAAIERRVGDRSGTNVKEGRGTIREIEFTMQLLQLLFGARRPGLRTGSTLKALTALEQAKLLSPEEQTRFRNHYVFFRTVEHRLQLLHDLPVRLLPDDPAELRKLARRMPAGGGCGVAEGEADQFMAVYRHRADEIQHLSRAILDRLTDDGVAASDPLRLLILALAPHSGVHGLGPGTREAGGYPQSGWSAQDNLSEAPNAQTPERLNVDLTVRLTAAGVRDPAAALERLRSLATGAPRFSLPLSTTRLLADLAEPLLAAMAAAPDPDGALSAVAEIAGRLGTHRTLYQTLRAAPDMLRVLCHVVGFSPAVRELVLRSPELLDVLYDEPFRSASRPAGVMRAEMEARRERAFSPADRLAALRRFQKRELLRIIARDLLSGSDAESTLRELSDLADTCVIGALESAADPTQEPGEVPGIRSPSVPGFAVFALGRLGGREMHYLSDLDLLYVYESQPGSGRSHRDYEALAGALTRALQDWLREGQLYPVDLRLRPEGKSGYMVVHLDAARRYYLGGRAQTWERQALTRARLIAGDPALAGQFMEISTGFVYGEPLSPEADDELRSMKRRIETERVAPEERARHLKLGPGGLSDIEFLVQRLQLRHGAAHLPLRTPGTLDALRAAADLELLPEDAVRDLHAGFTFLTRLRLHLRLRSSGTPTDLLPENPAEQQILARSLGLKTTAAMLDQYQTTTTRIRSLFDQYFLNG
jgi:glutamate-ammonia-ligase adenylyltransferase